VQTWQTFCAVPAVAGAFSRSDTRSSAFLSSSFGVSVLGSFFDVLAVNVLPDVSVAAVFGFSSSLESLKHLEHMYLVAAAPKNCWHFTHNLFAVEVEFCCSIDMSFLNAMSVNRYYIQAQLVLYNAFRLTFPEF
jgi:hypothetical protein